MYYNFLMLRICDEIDCFLASYLEEGRINLEIFRHYVQTEEMAIDSFAAHGVLVAFLVNFASTAQQLDAISILERKKENHTKIYKKIIHQV